MKAVYRLSELARMAGVSRKVMGRILKANGVLPRRDRGVQEFYLATLRAALPDLWDSIASRAVRE